MAGDDFASGSTYSEIVDTSEENTTASSGISPLCNSYNKRMEEGKNRSGTDVEEYTLPVSGLKWKIYPDKFNGDSSPTFADRGTYSATVPISAPEGTEETLLSSHFRRSVVTRPATAHPTSGSSRGSRQSSSSSVR